jgi:predicted ATPase
MLDRFEAGRGVMQEEIAIGGRALPWIDLILFAEMMLLLGEAPLSHGQLETGLVFFDRGVTDVVGCLRLLDLPVPQ